MKFDIGPTPAVWLGVLNPLLIARDIARPIFGDAFGTFEQAAGLCLLKPFLAKQALGLSIKLGCGLLNSFSIRPTHPIPRRILGDLPRCQNKCAADGQSRYHRSCNPCGYRQSPQKQKKPRDIGRFNGLLRRRWNLAFRQFLRPNRLRRAAATIGLPGMPILGGTSTLPLLPWGDPLERYPFIGGFTQHFQDTGGFFTHNNHFRHVQNGFCA